MKRRYRALVESSWEEPQHRFSVDATWDEFCELVSRFPARGWRVYWHEFEGDRLIATGILRGEFDVEGPRDD